MEDKVRRFSDLKKCFIQIVSFVFLKLRNVQVTIAENPEMKINSFHTQNHNSSKSYLIRQNL